MKSPVLSICVCCRNAYPRVKDTVHSLLCQTADAALYEILIVDNDSDDSEPLQAFINGLGMSADRMRLIVETDTGLAHARNRAVRESRGDYVFFLSMMTRLPILGLSNITFTVSMSINRMLSGEMSCRFLKFSLRLNLVQTFGRSGV